MFTLDLIFPTDDSPRGQPDFKPGDMVKTYKSSTKLEYPALWLSGSKFDDWRVRAMKAIFEPTTFLQEPGLYSVYLVPSEDQKQLVLIGKISGSRLGIVLQDKVFAVFKKQVMLSPDVVIEGDMIYALCTVSGF